MGREREMVRQQQQSSYTVEQLIAVNPYNPEILPDLESYVHEQSSRRLLLLSESSLPERRQPPPAVDPCRLSARGLSSRRLLPLRQALLHRCPPVIASTAARCHRPTSARLFTSPVARCPLLVACLPEYAARLTFVACCSVPVARRFTPHVSCSSPAPSAERSATACFLSALPASQCYQSSVVRPSSRCCFSAPSDSAFKLDLQTGEGLDLIADAMPKLNESSSTIYSRVELVLRNSIEFELELEFFEPSRARAGQARARLGSCAALLSAPPASQRRLSSLSAACLSAPVASCQFFVSLLFCTLIFFSALSAVALATSIAADHSCRLWYIYFRSSSSASSLLK
ncbi:Eukaryotic translation initiation factor 3 subunit K [Nymphaea thermarum]|nr:Eukaryotic translation initiation factor 3 subunit K [Nymphaea thermarum]